MNRRVRGARITIEAVARAPVRAVWTAFNEPADILAWDASEAWRTTRASNDLRVGGRLELRVEARGEGAGFDFGATYTEVRPPRTIAWRTDRDQRVRVEFRPSEAGTAIRQTFDVEPAPSADEQRRDWQAVLDRFARYAATITG